MFFENPEVEAKYKSLVPGGKDPIVKIVIGYDGPFSKVPMAIADKMHADQDAIALKKEEKPAAAGSASAKDKDK